MTSEANGPLEAALNMPGIFPTAPTISISCRTAETASKSKNVRYPEMYGLYMQCHCLPKGPNWSDNTTETQEHTSLVPRPTSQLRMEYITAYASSGSGVLLYEFLSSDYIILTFNVMYE